MPTVNVNARFSAPAPRPHRGVSRPPLAASVRPRLPTGWTPLQAPAPRPPLESRRPRVAGPSPATPSPAVEPPPFVIEAPRIAPVRTLLGG